MARSKDFLTNGGYENVDTSTSNNSVYDTQQKASAHQMSTSPIPSKSATTQPQTSQKPGKYEYRGNVYSSYEAAQQAQKAHQQKVQATQAMNEADLASVNYDFNKYNTLKNSGQLLSQISDNEWQYITKLQKTDTSPTAYTKSVRDQYLYSLGLPSSKDLAQYRAKYVKYASSGSINDVYNGMTKDEYDFIQRRFNEDTIAGFNGERIPKDTKNGKAIEYEDTLLDTQLKHAGLPSSELMNLYRAEYLRDKETDSVIQDIYNTTRVRVAETEKFNKAEIENLKASDWFKSKPKDEQDEILQERETSAKTSRQVFADVLEEYFKNPKYEYLRDYYIETENMPNADDNKYYYKDSKGQNVFDQDKYDADYEKALTKNIVKGDMAHRLSYSDFEDFNATETLKEVKKGQASSRQKLQDTALEWFQKPATTAAEKEQRQKDIDAFVRFGNNEGNIKQAMQTLASTEWYFNALDAGVPYEVAMSGKGAIDTWNNASNTKDVKSWTEVATTNLGYEKGDYPYESVSRAFKRTRIEANAANFDRTSVYDSALYDRQLQADDTVTVYGAAYAEVNGATHADIQADADEKALNDFNYLFRPNQNSLKGDPLVTFLTDTEKGVFNSIFRRNPKEALNYLISMNDILIDRAHDSEVVAFYDSPNMSDNDYYGYAYDTFLMNEDDVNNNYVEGTRQGWKKSAWFDYRRYSDDEIDAMLEDLAVEEERLSAIASNKTVASNPFSAQSGMQSQMGGSIFQWLANRQDVDLAGVQEEIRALNYVKEEREKARIFARDAVDTRNYEESAGKQATETVKNNLDQYAQDSKYVMYVNGAIESAYQPESGVNPFNYQSPDPSIPPLAVAATADWRDDSIMQTIKNMTDEQKYMFNWLLLNKNGATADHYVESVMKGIDVANAKRTNDALVKFATGSKDNAWSEVGTSALSVITFPLTGFAAMTGTALNYMNGVETSRTQATQWDFTGAWRDAITSEIDSVWGQLGYSALMSSLDSSVSMAVNTLVPFMGESMMAASAYASTLRRGLDEGLDTNQAVQSALASAAIEFITEHIGLDAIGKGIENIGIEAAKKAGRNIPIGITFLKNILGSGLSEGSEEVASHVMNYVADYFMNGDKRELQRQHDAIMEQQGLSSDEAWKLVWRDWAIDGGMSFAAGALSGGGMTGIGGGTQMLRYAGVKTAVAVNQKLKEFAYGKETKPLSDEKPPFTPMSAEQVSAFKNSKKWLGDVIPSRAVTHISNMVNRNKIDTASVSSLTDFLTNMTEGSLTYEYVRGKDGNLKLNNEQLTALATALSAVNASPNVDSVDASFVRLMNANAAVQSMSKVTPKFIKENAKTFQELRGLLDQIEYFNNKIREDQVAFNNWGKDDLAELNGIAQRIKALEESGRAETDPAKKGTIQEQIIPLQKEYAKQKTKYDTAKKAQERDLKNKIKDSQTQIKVAQDSIAKHYAAVASLLGKYAPKSFDGGRTRTSQLAYREEQLGAKIDQYSKAKNLDAKSRKAQVARLTNQLAETRRQRERLRDMMVNEGNALSDALNAVRTGTVDEFMQTQDALNEARRSQTNSTVESSAQPTSEQNRGSDEVIEDYTPIQFSFVDVSTKDQQALSRSFDRIGYTIEWDSSLNGKANAQYDNDTKKIRVATSQRTPNGKNPAIQIAQATIIHEISHTVTGTYAYTDLQNDVLDYLIQKHGNDYVNRVANSIMAQELRDYGREITPEHALEEVVAHFTEEMLFNNESGNTRTLMDMVKRNRTFIGQILEHIQHMITRGTVRKMSKNDPVRVVLIDAEYHLAKAIREKEILNNAGKQSVFEAPSEAKANTPKQAQTPEQSFAEQDAEFEREVERVAETPASEQSVEEVADEIDSETPKYDELPVEHAAEEPEPAQSNPVFTPKRYDSGYTLSEYANMYNPQSAEQTKMAFDVGKFVGREYLRNRSNFSIAEDVLDFVARSMGIDADDRFTFNPFSLENEHVAVTSGSDGYSRYNASVLQQQLKKMADAAKIRAYSMPLPEEQTKKEEKPKQGSAKRSEPSRAGIADRTSEDAKKQIYKKSGIEEVEPYLNNLRINGYPYIEKLFNDALEANGGNAVEAFRTIANSRTMGVIFNRATEHGAEFRNEFKNLESLFERYANTTKPTNENSSENLALWHTWNAWWKYKTIKANLPDSESHLLGRFDESAEQRRANENVALDNESPTDHERMNNMGREDVYTEDGITTRDVMPQHQTDTQFESASRGKSSEPLSQEYYEQQAEAERERERNSLVGNYSDEQRAIFRAQSKFLDTISSISRYLTAPIQEAHSTLNFDPNLFRNNYMKAYKLMQTARVQADSILNDEQLSTKERKVMTKLWDNVCRQYSAMYNLINSKFLDSINDSIDRDYVNHVRKSETVQTKRKNWSDGTPVYGKQSSARDRGFAGSTDTHVRYVKQKQDDGSEKVVKQYVETFTDENGNESVVNVSYDREPVRARYLSFNDSGRIDRTSEFEGKKMSSGMTLAEYAQAARYGDGELMPWIENMTDELREDIANTLENTGGDLFERAVEYGEAGNGYISERGQYRGDFSDVPFLLGREEQSGTVPNGSSEGRTAVRYAVPDAVNGTGNGNVQETGGQSSNIRYSSGLTMDELVHRYGRHRQNQFARDNGIQIAQRRTKTKNISQSLQTWSSMEYAQQSFRDFVAEQAVTGEYDDRSTGTLGAFTTKKIDSIEQHAINSLARQGGISNDAILETIGAMDNVNASNLETLIAKGAVIIRELGAEGMEKVDPKVLYDFLGAYGNMCTSWGRQGNIMKLINKLPQGRKAYWERVVRSVNKKNANAVSRGTNPLIYRGGYQEIVIPDALYNNLVAARNQTEINEAEYAITQYIGQHSPLTVSAALRNWRYFAMLANPVTHARNMMGNAGMLGARTLKDFVATGLENVAVKAGLMNENQRTHAITLTADSLDIAKSLWDENAEFVQLGGHEGFQQKVNEAVKKFPGKFGLVDKGMRINSNALESEDKLFLYATFISAARQYITAQGITSGKMTKAQKGAIVEYATQQAQEATYRDAVYIADVLNQLSHQNAVAQVLIDAIMPFKKTPINIARRGIEYSPMGLISGMYHIVRDVVDAKNGKRLSVPAAKVCDELAKGLTGSALALIGFFLSKLGILKATAGEGDRDEAFEKDIGRQDYSLEIGNMSIKIEQLAPLTFPLFMGSAFEKLSKKDWDSFSLADFGDALLTVADPLMDMSFLSGLNTVLETYDEDKLSGMLKNALVSYTGQYLPTIGSKINNTTPFIGDTRLTAKSDASANNTQLDYQLRAWASKIPIVNKAVLEPYVSTTGEYQQKTSFGDWVLAHLNNFALPVNVQIVDATPVNNEIARLYTITGTTDFIPQQPKKYMRVNGVNYNMTASEYTQFSKEHNETVYAAITNVIESQEYQRSSDDHKAEMLEYAYDTAHTAVSEKYKAIFTKKMRQK